MNTGANTLDIPLGVAPLRLCAFALNGGLQPIFHPALEPAPSSLFTCMGLPRFPLPSTSCRLLQPLTTSLASLMPGQIGNEMVRSLASSPLPAVRLAPCVSPRTSPLPTPATLLNTRARPLNQIGTAHPR